MPVASVSKYSSSDSYFFQMPKSSKQQQSHSLAGKFVVAFNEGTAQVSKFKDLVLKVIYHITGWMGEFNVQASPSVYAFGDLAKKTKNFLGIAQFGTNLTKVYNSTSKGNFTDAFFDTVECVSPAYDFTSALVADNVAEVSKTAMKTFGFINYSALVTGMTRNLYKNYNKFDADMSTEQKTSLMFEVGKNVSYFALGVIGAVGFVFALTASYPSWLLLACSTSALTFSITGFFYDKIVEPNKAADHHKRCAAPAA